MLPMALPPTLTVKSTPLNGAVPVEGEAVKPSIIKVGAATLTVTLLGLAVPPVPLQDRV